MANRERELTALKVHQWVPAWDSLDFEPGDLRRKPRADFYLFAIQASDLRALAGIQRRVAAAGQPRTDDTGIQRRHDEGRSAEIGRFVEYGFPWSDLSESARESGDFSDLRKPGWLPTAVVINMLESGDERRGVAVSDNDLVTVADDDKYSRIVLPDGFSGRGWMPSGGLPPVEVIDGQHRLWAFDHLPANYDFELPVVAFHGLDISWQAYLFWTINIKPQRINASLAFDLYPLLRTEDWLERFQGHSVYRETRAQELVESIWSHPESPWRGRINMLGEPGLPWVRQAAWIRSLVATYVKASEGQRIQVGGLFGARVGSDQAALPWTSAQQAAYLISAWRSFQRSVVETKSPWALALRHVAQPQVMAGLDPAFFGSDSMINSDPGVRAVLYVTNDLAFVRAEELRLADWLVEPDVRASDEDAVTRAMKSFSKQPASRFLKAIAESLSTYDWRGANAPGLSPQQRLGKRAIRGSGGYRELRSQVLHHLAKADGVVGEAAAVVITRLGY